jgi:hypothetical protein
VRVCACACVCVCVCVCAVELIIMLQCEGMWGLCSPQHNCNAHVECAVADLERRQVWQKVIAHEEALEAREKHGPNGEK